MKDRLFTSWDQSNLSHEHKDWLTCELVHFFRLAFLWPAYLIAIFLDFQPWISPTPRDI